MTEPSAPFAAGVHLPWAEVPADVQRWAAGICGGRPVEVRDLLLAIGVDLSIYSSELAVIHTVLKRLNEAGEIRLIPRAGGKHAYLWQHPPTAIRLGPEIAQFVRELEESGKKVVVAQRQKTTPSLRPRKRSK